MKVGEIKDAIQKMADENKSLKQELSRTKFLAQRLMTNNLNNPLSDEEVIMVKESVLELFQGKIQWFKE